jgi:hypothetical protein
VLVREAWRRFGGLPHAKRAAMLPISASDPSATHRQRRS